MSEYIIGRDISNLEERVTALEKNSSCEEQEENNFGKYSIYEPIDINDFFPDVNEGEVDLKSLEIHHTYPIGNGLNKYLINFHKDSSHGSLVLEGLSKIGVETISITIGDRTIIEFFEKVNNPIDIYKFIPDEDKTGKCSTCNFGRRRGLSCSGRTVYEENIDCGASRNRCWGRGNDLCGRSFACYRC